ncbi:NUDIX hydrolase [Streptomyces sp. NPDC048639]|uniref:NUDIX hydrolase n=1 Tax=Streptomyces sp. NPDC048639 TaxID=3365581 RepID=UPI00371BBBCF
MSRPQETFGASPGTSGAFDGEITVSADGLPAWLDPVVRAAETVEPEQLSRFLPPDSGGRPSAVLILFGDGGGDGGGTDDGETGSAVTDEMGAHNAGPHNAGPHSVGPHSAATHEVGPHSAGTTPARPGAADTSAVPGPATAPVRSDPAGPSATNGHRPELLLMERAGTLRSHAGQPSFPGGALDPEDGDPRTVGPLRAALREAWEETGLDPSGVQIFGALPRLYIPVSGFVVTPVLGWWRAPSPVAPVDPAETARVFTVPVAELTDPANRAVTTHPSGYQGPAFLVRDALVWGFTAGVIDRLLHFAGWERPWDRSKHVPLDWSA